MKKIVILFSAITLFLHGYAQEGVYTLRTININGVYYNILSDGTAEVTNHDGGSSDANTYSGTIIILPSITYNGTTYNVTKIGENAFAYCEELNEVIIPDRVKEIGRAAFAGCENLYNINLPKYIKTIGNYAFFRTSISKIDIPEHVESIGMYAFLNSRRLKFVNLPESVKSVGHLAFANTNITTPIYNSLIFAYLPPNYSKYSIPDGIEIVADGAFACCYNLDSVVFPMSVKIIGEQAFAANNGFKPEIPGCPYLKEINIPGVRIIKEDAFYKCKGLKKVTIGNNIERLEERCFHSCSELEIVTIGTSLKYIDYGAFSTCGKLKTITLPNGLLKIGAYAFNRCDNLVYLSIPSSVIEIGENAFKNMPYIIYTGSAKGAPWGAKAVCQ